MAAYRLEVHDTQPVDHITRVCCFTADTGTAAAELARQILTGTPGTYGDLSVDDSTGEWLPYETIGGTR